MAICLLCDPDKERKKHGTEGEGQRPKKSPNDATMRQHVKRECEIKRRNEGKTNTQHSL